jgi:predicted nucleotidyltransferase
MHERFTAALAAVLADVRQDRSILAAILCGSLAHDTVWEKSDIDLMLVTTDDREARLSQLAVAADGVNVHINLLARAEFRKVVNSAIHNSFVHSLLAKGRLLHTTDETIRDLFDRLGEIGAHDTELQLLSAATHALPPIDKAHKWFVTRGDLE